MNQRRRCIGIVMFVLLIFLTVGCAGKGNNIKPNSWLPKHSSISIEGTEGKDKVIRRNLEDIAKILDDNPDMRESDFKKLIGDKNVQNLGILSSLKLVFPHEGIKPAMVGRGIQDSIKNKILFHSQIIIDRQESEEEVGSFLKNMAKFRKTKKVEDNSKILMVFFSESGKHIHHEMDTKNRLVLLDKINPWGFANPENILDKVFQEFIKQALEKSIEQYMPF